MATWTTITNALVAVGAKPFATTIAALRDNPIAIVEGATGAPGIAGGLELIEVLQPTSDGNDITFLTDVSIFRDIVVEVAASRTAAYNSLDLEIRASGGTWRRIAYVDAGVSFAKFRVSNINNQDGSSVILGWCEAAFGVTAGVVRADTLNTAFDQGTSRIHGYSTFNEVIAEVRLITNGAGDFEGSDASLRSVARLYGYRGFTREDDL